MDYPELLNALERRSLDRCLAATGQGCLETDYIMDLFKWEIGGNA